MNNYIRLTKKLIEKTFDECNERYFNNEVDKPHRFEIWTPNKKCVGWVRAAYPKKVARTKRADGVRPLTYLHISNRYNWTMENLRDTIVHEMIHLHIKDFLIPLSFWQRLFHSLQHNERFKAEMSRLNSSYPELHLSVRAKHMRKEFKG